MILANPLKSFLLMNKYTNGMKSVPQVMSSQTRTRLIFDHLSLVLHFLFLDYILNTSRSTIHNVNISNWHINGTNIPFFSQYAHFEFRDRSPLKSFSQNIRNIDLETNLRSEQFRWENSMIRLSCGTNSWYFISLKELEKPFFTGVYS